MKRVVFIVSAGHSGSTLLDLLLGSHGAGFSLGEVKSLAGRLADDPAAPLCGVCDGPCPFWDRPGLRPRLRSHFAPAASRWPPVRALDRRFGALRGDLYALLFEHSGAGLLVDSSKATWWVARQTLPPHHWRRKEPWLLYLHRDGRAVVASLLRKYPQRDVAALAATWARHTEERERFYHRFPGRRRLRLSYEALTADPEAAMGTLCERLGVPFQPGMLRYWRHDHHPVQGNLGTRSLIFRFREELGATTRAGERWRRTGRADAEHYRQVGLAIRPDERWRSELSAPQLTTFGRIAGELNDRLLRRGGTL